MDQQPITNTLEAIKQDVVCNKHELMTIRIEIEGK